MAEEKEKKVPKRHYRDVEPWMLKDQFFNAGARFKIYVIIRSFTILGKTGKCFYSLSDFEENTGLQRRVIGRAIQDLQENGYIVIEKDGQRNTYKSLEKINETRDKMSLDKKSLVGDKELGTKCPRTRDKLSTDWGQKVPRLGTKCPQHPNLDLNLELNNKLNIKAVNICYLDNTPLQSGPNLVIENGKKEEKETAEKDTAETAKRHDGNTTDGNNGNDGCPTPSDNNPSLSLTDDDADTATAEGTAKADGKKATATTEDKDKETLDRILAERPIEEIVTDKLIEIYPQGKIDLTRGEILFRLRNISHLDEETIYILTLVKETMDINPYYVPKLSRYLDQGSYLQHYRVRMPLNEFSADYLAKKEWEGKMTKEDWKEAGDLLLREFDLGGDGFHDPLPEPSEEEKKEALAWLDSMGKTEGGTKR